MSALIRRRQMFDGDPDSRNASAAVRIRLRTECLAAAWSPMSTLAEYRRATRRSAP